jgi:ubiquinone/menaquinone biosynthesis C-methylase UbiE
MTVQKDPEHSESKHLQSFIDLRGKRVLEIGCGEGRFTWRYAAACKRVIGIDVDRDGLRVASIERSADLEGIASFAQADSVHLPFPGNAFDIAIFSWSF